MKLHRLLTFAAAFILLGSVAFGESKRRTEKGSFSNAVTGFVVGQCDGFQILADWVFQLSWVDLYDKSGQFVQEIDHYRVLGQTVYYNSEDPTKAVFGGPGESEQSQYDGATGMIYGHGAIWKIKVPGYGVIFAETGTYILQCDPYTFSNCELVSNTGHNQFWDNDLAAVCDYLN